VPLASSIYDRDYYHFDRVLLGNDIYAVARR
jgi:hypothetical protein